MSFIINPGVMKTLSNRNLLLLVTNIIAYKNKNDTMFYFTVAQDLNYFTPILQVMIPIFYYFYLGEVCLRVTPGSHFSSVTRIQAKHRTHWLTDWLIYSLPHSLFYSHTQAYPLWISIFCHLFTNLLSHSHHSSNNQSITHSFTCSLTHSITESRNDHFI